MNHSHYCQACDHRWEGPADADACPRCRAAVPVDTSLQIVLQMLTALEQRIARLEVDAAVKVDAVPHARIVADQPTPSAKVEPPLAKPFVDDKSAQVLKDWFDDFTERQRATRPSPPKLKPKWSPAEPEVLATPVDAAELERKIGLHWAAWLGAIIFVLGVGLGIKFALDNGWLNFITPVIRILLLSLGGFALIGAGEYVYRRVQPLAAVGLFGAGIAVLFFAGFAGNVFYELYSRDLAFIFTALVAFIGSGVAWRSGFVSVGVLAQLGGNLAPVILASNQRPDLPFFGYLYLLEGFALLLVWWGAERKWWAVRLLSLCTTLIWISLSLGSRGATLGWGDDLLWFMLLAIVTFHAEFLRSALQAEVVTEAVGHRLKELRQAGGLYLLGLTLTAVYYGLLLLEPLSAEQRGVYLAGLAGGTGLVGLLLWRTGLQIPRGLAWNYGLQTITLLLLVVPVVLEGPWVSLGWMLLGLAFTLWGTTQAYSTACWAGVTAWLLSLTNLGRLLLFEPKPEMLLATGVTVLEVPLPIWFICFLLTAAGGLVQAMLLQTRRLWPGRQVSHPFLPLARIVMGLAVGVAVFTLLMPLPLPGSTLGILAAVGVLALLRPLAPRLRLEVPILLLLLLAVGKWLTLDSLSELEAIEHQPLARQLLANRYTGVGLLAIVSLLAGLRLCRRRLGSLCRLLGVRAGQTVTRGSLAGILFIGLTALVGMGCSVELLRALGQLHAHGCTAPWPAEVEQILALLIFWALLITGLGELLRGTPRLALLPWHLLGVLAGAWLLFGAVVPRLSHGPVADVPVLLNLQFLAAAAVLLTMAWSHHRRRAAMSPEGAWVLVAATVVLLAAGTLEVDRALPASLAAGGLPINAKHAGISVFWSLFAVGAVAVGFWRRLAWLRYFGLGLFALTLGKVGLVDLGGVAYGYRIISLLVLGLLLLGTSVLYGYLSPRLLPEPQDEEISSPPT